LLNRTTLKILTMTTTISQLKTSSKGLICKISYPKI